jgi:hypothetical protein
MNQKWPPISIFFNREKALLRSIKIGLLSTISPTSSFFPSPSVLNSTALLTLAGEYPVLPMTCWLEILSNKSSHRFPLHVIDGGVRMGYMDAVSVFVCVFVLCVFCYVCVFFFVLVMCVC